MKQIGDFFSRFASLTPPNESIRIALVRAIEEVLGAKVSKEQIRISRGVAYVQAGSIIKSSVIMRRGDILDRVYLEAPKARDVVRDVR